MCTVDNSGSNIFYDAFLVDIPCSVSDILGRVLYAMHIVIVDFLFCTFVCPRYGRQTYHKHRVDVICRLTGCLLGI